MNRYRLSIILMNTYMPQSINSFMTLSCKSIDWFLYGKDFCHERVKALFTIILQKSVLTCPLLFLTGFSFTNMMIHGTAGKGSVSLYPFHHFYLLQKYLDISQVVAAESTLLRRAGSRTRTGNLWFPSASH